MISFSNRSHAVNARTWNQTNGSFRSKQTPKRLHSTRGFEPAPRDEAERNRGPGERANGPSSPGTAGTAAAGPTARPLPLTPRVGLPPRPLATEKRPLPSAPPAGPAQAAKPTCSSSQRSSHGSSPWPGGGRPRQRLRCRPRERRGEEGTGKGPDSAPGSGPSTRSHHRRTTNYHNMAAATAVAVAAAALALHDGMAEDRSLPLMEGGR